MQKIVCLVLVIALASMTSASYYGGVLPYYGGLGMGYGMGGYGMGYGMGGYGGYGLGGWGLGGMGLFNPMMLGGFGHMGYAKYGGMYY